MGYHIDTALIWEKFKEKNECPICEIEKIVEGWIVEQFLTEAVMEDASRERVNKSGFCARHFRMLFNGLNKLGTALQTHTRMQRVFESIIFEEKDKKFDAVIANHRKQTCTCAICEQIEFNMNRYYETVAQMYKKEKDFPALLAKSRGFCLDHYAHLLEKAKFAGLKKKEYEKELVRVERGNWQRLMDELDWFCDKFDHRNADKPWGNSKDSLERCISKLQKHTFR